MHKSRDVNGMEGEVEMEPFQTENNPFAYSVPTDEGGYYCSYDNCTMYYYDSNGEKFEVDIS